MQPSQGNETLLAFMGGLITSDNTRNVGDVPSSRGTKGTADDVMVLEPVQEDLSQPYLHDRRPSGVIKNEGDKTTP